MARPIMDSIEWLEMMAGEYSPLEDCKPHFLRIAEELRQLRARVVEHDQIADMVSEMLGGVERRLTDRIMRLRGDITGQREPGCEA